MAAADVGSPGAQNGGVRALRPAGTEFQHRPALGSPDNPVGLGGDQALVVDAQQEIRLNELGLNGRCPDGDNRLIGEDRRALGDGPDIAGELKVRQILQKFLAEHIPAAQVLDVLRTEVQVLNILDDLLQTCRNGKSAAIGALPEEQVKIGNTVAVTGGKITLTHGQLIIVTQHGEIQLVIDNHTRSPLSE